MQVLTLPLVPRSTQPSKEGEGTPLRAGRRWKSTPSSSPLTLWGVRLLTPAGMKVLASLPSPCWGVSERLPPPGGADV